jgi:HTH-type transcriptional regulator / antitoxin HigA
MEPKKIYSNVAIPPGDHLAEMLEELEISQAELARRMGRPPQVISEIVRGKKVITAETAIQLEKAINVPAYIWLNLESRYQLTKLYIAQAAKTKKRAS